jgi:hypothetical protein
MGIIYSALLSNREGVLLLQRGKEGDGLGHAQLPGQHQPCLFLMAMEHVCLWQSKVR